MKLVKYRIYCTTDSKYEYVWQDETDPAPTTCPIDPVHTIDVNGISVVDTLEENDVKVKEQPPFATPDHRTKRDATASWVVVTELDEPSGKVIDFQMPEERYVTGGKIIFKDVKEGDYITAEVYDKDGVIPEAYRAALCEAHPTVAKYVIKMWLKPTTVGEYSELSIDTYPLNAQISEGLYLRVTYHPTTEVGERKCAINYNLTVKL